MSEASGSQLSPPDPEAATAAIERALAGAPDEEVRRYGDMLERLAFHMSSRIEYAESRRSSIATSGTAILAAGIATIALVKDLPSVLRVSLSVLGVAFIVVGIAVLGVYARQTNFKYGFIKSGLRFQRPWKWFYRDALESSDAFRAPWHTFQSEEDRRSTAEAFEAQWAPFAERYETLRNPRVDAIQNLKQVYLLQVNERYKNLFLSQLRTVLFKGLALAIVAFAATFVVAAATHSSGKPGSPVTPTSPAHVSPSVRPSPSLINPSSS